MSAVQTAPARPSARTRPVAEVAIILLVLALGASVLALVREPPRVARVAVVNPSSRPVEVSVAAHRGGATLGLGQAVPHSTLRVDDVVDQGGRWVFTYRSANCGLAHQAVSQRILARSGWHVVIPEEAIAAIESGCLRPG